MTALYVFLWLCGSVSGWWLMCRYVDKEIVTGSYTMGIPISLLAGPFLPLIALIILGYRYIEYKTSINKKLLKKWK